MTTHTTDDFRTARFATHPDGRIAARIDPGSDDPWVHLGRFDLSRWVPDDFMARDGWSPLDETRLPVVVTDEPEADWKARAEKAEQELDVARIAGRLAVQQRDAERERADAAESMTAREHLAAAWDTAHVPANGTIPAGAEYVWSSTGGAQVHGPWEAPNDLAARISSTERRLLDPPAPKRPEGARPLDPIVLDTLREHGQAPDGETVVSISDALAERGVRAPGTVVES